MLKFAILVLFASTTVRGECDAVTCGENEMACPGWNGGPDECHTEVNFT